ncbi:MAG: hypothetical protein Q9157_003792 [Trypethelium eluteriae]
MLLDISQNALPQYALQGSGLNVACSLADELDTKLLALLLVTKQASFPDDLRGYKLQVYNWAHDVRNRLHFISLAALHAGNTGALEEFSSIYGECQSFRTVMCDDPASFMFPDVLVAVQGLAITKTTESSAAPVADHTQGTVEMWAQNQTQGGDVLIDGAVPTNKTDLILLEAVEKILSLRQGDSLPSPSSSEMMGGPTDNEHTTNTPSTWKGNVKMYFDFEPPQPIPEPITPAEFATY